MSTKEEDYEEDPCFKCLMESEELTQCPDCEHVIKFLQKEAI